MAIGWIILIAMSMVICWATLLASRIATICKPTTSDIEGPYYMAGAPFRNSGVLCNLTEPLINGTNLIIKGRVTEDDCQTGVHALLDVWQADSLGEYALMAGDYNCRGKMHTDPAGYFSIQTVLPGWYPEGGTYRPAHIHWKVSPLNRAKEILTTQLYFQHDPFLAEKDPCHSYCHSGDPTITVPLHKGLAKKNNTMVVLWGIVLRSPESEKGIN